MNRFNTTDPLLCCGPGTGSFPAQCASDSEPHGPIVHIGTGPVCPPVMLRCSPPAVPSSAGPAKDVVPRPAPSDEDAPQRTQCVLCNEKFGDSGDHQVASLKCGHVFGLKCIEKHLATDKRCPMPSCLKKATVKDVQRLFVSSVDTFTLESEEELQKQLDEEQVRKRKLEEDIEENRRQEAGIRKKYKVCPRGVCRGHRLRWARWLMAFAFEGAFLDFTANFWW